MNDNNDTTDFGYQRVTAKEKTKKVEDVFHSVAHKYDVMNDLMSLGLHRLWKRFAIDSCSIRPGQLVLDLAGGTGDLTRKISPLVGKKGRVFIADINASMLDVGRDRLIDQGIMHNIAFIQANAEQLPFASNSLDRIVMSFGLRNVTNKAKALQSMYRVLKPAGKLIILEFSQPTISAIKPIYDLYSFKILPLLGKTITNDEKSYRYLAESIRMHPNQKTLADMLSTAEFENVQYNNLSGGLVAIHTGYKY